MEIISATIDFSNLFAFQIRVSNVVPVHHSSFGLSTHIHQLLQVLHGWSSQLTFVFQYLSNIYEQFGIIYVFEKVHKLLTYITHVYIHVYYHHLYIIIIHI